MVAPACTSNTSAGRSPSAWTSRSAPSATTTAIAGNPSVQFYPEWPDAKRNTDPRFAGAVDAFERSLRMAKDRTDADLVHCHTWYTDMAGIIAAQLWDIPSVLTIHSLEPLRPWKVEQLGQAYHLSAWMERTAIQQASAVIAVSNETSDDVLRLFDIAPERVHVIHNGIDLDEYRPSPKADVLDRHGVDRTRPYLLFVGRITRQKGILHLLHAIPHLDSALQIVLCAGAPDTPEIGREMEAGVRALQATRPGIIWISDMLPRADVIQLYTHAAVFCCPSVYEPFGHHQSRGDGVRHARGGLRGRRHQGSRRTGRNRLSSGPPCRPRGGRARRPRRVCRRVGRRDQPPGRRPRPARPDGRRRTPPRAGLIHLGRHREPDQTAVSRGDRAPLTVT